MPHGKEAERRTASATCRWESGDFRPGTDCEPLPPRSQRVWNTLGSGQEERSGHLGIPEHDSTARLGDHGIHQQYR